MTRQSTVATAVMMVIGVAAADDYVSTADANGDGFVSLHELRAAYFADPDFNRRIEQSFSRYDRNGDGLISAEERRAVDGSVANSSPQITPAPETRALLNRGKED